MKCWKVLSAALMALLPFLAGCGDDGGSKNIDGVLLYMQESTNQLSAMTKSIQKLPDLAKKLKEATDDKEKKETGEKFDKEVNSVLAATNQLKEQAKYLVGLSQKQYTPAGTEEERRELAKKFRNRLTDDLKNLEAARKDLTNALKEANLALAEPKHKEDLKKIEFKLREADSDFESISRPQ